MKKVTILNEKAFLEDFKSKKLTSDQMVDKYNLTGRTMLYNKICKYRKDGLLPKSHVSNIISKAMREKHANKATVRSEAGYKAAITRAENKLINAAPQYRSIFFPGGFTIQVEKQSLNRIVLHKDGSVTVVND